MLGDVLRRRIRFGEIAEADAQIATFYDVAARRGAIKREDIEADTSSMLPVWALLRPFLEEWVATHPTLEDWERQLVTGVMAYENHRLRFVNDDRSAKAGMAACGDNWGAFVSNIDIAAVFDAMQTSEPLKQELIQESAIVLVRQKANSYRAYTTDVSRIGELPLHPYVIAAEGAGTTA
jgi:hypothetical protein